MVRKPPYLLLRRGTYHFRMVVPVRLREIFRRSEYKRSLRTGDMRSAGRLSEKLREFVEQYFLLVDVMSPDTELIKFLIRNHFEKCLLDAEDQIWGARGDRVEVEENAEHVLASVDRLTQQLQDLKYVALTSEYGQPQEEIARELLHWQKVTLSPFHELYKQLCRGIMSAHVEATRLHIAHFRGDFEGMRFQPEIFKDCRNFFDQPAFDEARKFSGLAYHEIKEPVSNTVEGAVDQYLKFKEKETFAWHQANRPYLERMIEILGSSTNISTLKKRDGEKIEELLWQIPSNYKRDFSHIPLQSFFDGDQGNYARIKAATVKQYYMGIKVFFGWCEDKDILPTNIMSRVRLNRPKSGSHLQQEQRRIYSLSELETLFNSPLYTGHKYTGREYWVPGDIVERKGYFWVPLVALFAGLREAEILYLQVSDIRRSEGTNYINVDQEYGKKIKTAQSERKIPIHPVLKKIGFLEYVAERQRKAKSPSEKLFDGITYPSGDNAKVIKNFSRNYNNILRKIGLKIDKSLDFHSLRYSYCSVMARVPGITVEIMDPLDGRDSISKARGTRKTYVEKYTPTELYPWVHKMDFKVDLSHLYIKKTRARDRSSLSSSQ